MYRLIRIFLLLAAGISTTGCIVDHTLSQDGDMPGYPGDPDPSPVSCNLENPVCDEGQICALVDPCGSPCPADAHEAGLACPQVCVEVYACVQPKAIGELCRPDLGGCDDRLACSLDEGRCGPTDCYEMGCAECPPVYTCQSPMPPTTCEDLDCRSGFVCEILVSEGCGYADPDEQRMREICPEESAVCIQLEDHRIGDSCDDTACMVGFQCQETPVYLPCENCDQPADIHVNCIPDSGHRIGETCDDTTCLQGYECWEIDDVVCQGPGCDQDPKISVSCEPVQPPSGIVRPLPDEGESCVPAEGACAGELHCLVDVDAGCQPSFCEGDFCTTDCVANYTCQSAD